MALENDLYVFWDKIKDNPFIKKLTYVFLIIANYLSRSPNKFSYIGAGVIGLGLARLVDVFILYTMASKLGVAVPQPISSHNLNRSASSVVFILDPNSIIGGYLFAPEPPPVPVVTEQDPAKPIVEAKDFMLMGTVSGDPSFARAVLQVFNVDDPVREYATKDTIGIDKIILIERDYIILKRGDLRVKLPVGMRMSEVVVQATAKAALTATTSATGDVVKRTLSRQEVNKVLKGNSSQIYKGASFGPILDNDVITGYKIHKVESDHFFYQIGARSGDIIKRVNGFELNDTERMFELWNSMKDARNVQIELERNGKAMRFEFTIAN